MYIYIYISLVFSVQYVEGTTVNALKSTSNICIYVYSRYSVKRLYFCILCFMYYHRLGNSYGGTRRRRKSETKTQRIPFCVAADAEDGIL